MKATGSGGCHCGNVSFVIGLPGALEKYSPRECDCDFCKERNLSYLSHPDGVLEMECSEPVDVIQQGSGQAMFLACKGCGVVVAVVHRFPDFLKGAVNARLLNEIDRLQPPTIVSPRLLDPEGKLARWERIWSRVRINSASAPSN